MGKEKVPVTPAIRQLKDNRIDFTPCPYKYEEAGGTSVAARELGVDESKVIKTLVMQDENKNPFLVLMHGDKSVSTKSLARAINVKNIKPCDPQTANKHTGYIIGGISPFGTKKQLKVYIEATILELDKIYINAGRKGLLAEMSPKDLERVLKAVTVNAAI